MSCINYDDCDGGYSDEENIADKLDEKADLNEDSE